MDQADAIQYHVDKDTQARAVARQEALKRQIAQEYLVASFGELLTKAILSETEKQKIDVLGTVVKFRTAGHHLVKDKQGNPTEEAADKPLTLDNLQLSAALIKEIGLAFQSLQDINKIMENLNSAPQQQQGAPVAQQVQGMVHEGIGVVNQFEDPSHTASVQRR